MPRLNPDSRGQIIGLLQANVSQRRLARQFNVSQSTISPLSRKFAVTGSTKDRPRPGAPRVTTQIRIISLGNVIYVIASQPPFQPLPVCEDVEGGISVGSQ